MALLLTILSVWLLVGFVPSVLYMMVRARQTYYVNHWRPLWGALQGPFAAWYVWTELRRHGSS